MREQEAELLRAQLQDARAEEEPDPIELAALSGLLSRLTPDDPALHERPELDPQALHDAAEEALDAVLDADEDDDPAETWDALCALDELCAAATFSGQGGVLLPFVDEASRAVRAFPEPWSTHADAATELLRDRAPLPGDPARLLWAAIAASRWPSGVTPQGLGASDAAKRFLGLKVVISLRSLGGDARPHLNAAGPLPEEPPWRTLAKGEGWELAITEDEAGQQVLLLFGASGAFERDGAGVSPVKRPEGLRTPALAGDWVVTVGEERVPFQLDP